MDRLRLFRLARAEASAHEERWGSHQAIQWIIEQLEYLEGVEVGSIEDRSLLRRINLGLLAAREIEDRDARLAKLLHKVSAEVEKMPKPPLAFD